MLNRYTALALVLSMASGTMAQNVSLSATDNAPVLGSGFSVNTGNYVAAPAGGASQIFDFTGLSATGTRTYSWIDPALYSNAAAFPAATLALVNTGNTDTLFYHVTASGLERLGEKQAFAGFATVEVAYTDGLLELQLPLAFGDTWTDPGSANFDANGNPVVRTGSITGAADAWGTIHLPGDITRNTLRVHTRITETNTSALTVQHRHTSFEYYTPWVKGPVLRCYGDSLNSSLVNQEVGASEWLTDAQLGVAQNGSDAFGLDLFPNPANGTVELTFATFSTGAINVDVLDVRGALVMRKELGTSTPALRREHLDVSSLKSGLYQLRLMDANGMISVKPLSVVR